MSSGLYSGVSGLALGTGLYKDTSGLWGGASGLIDGFGFGNPTLNLNFLPMSTLPSTVTFSRTTQATLVDATGRVTYAPNNLLTNSESFEASAWNKSGATVTANSTAAPDGTTTADALVEDATTGLHLTQQSFAFVSGVSYTVSVYVKAGIRTWVQMLLPSAAFTASQGGFFDLTGAGALGTTNGTPTARTITALANGWYRISVTATATTSASGNVAIVAASANGTTSYAGSNGSTAVLLWGAQLEAVTYQTTPGTYNSTTPKNLLGFTQEFDNAAWTKSNATVTANATAAPDGTLSADKLVEDTANAAHRAWQAPTTAAAAHTFSVYLKAAERSFALLYAGVTNVGVMVNLSTGATNAVAGITAPTSSSVTDVGNGWYRCSMTFTTTAAASSVFVYLANNSTSFSYLGDGTSGIFIWGAQLSNSASLDPYVYNPAAAPTSAAFYGPRFDFDPVSLAPRGLLIEEQRANRTLQSENFTVSPWEATVLGTSTRVNDGSPLGFTRGLITATSANGGIRQSLGGLTSGQVYALSFYIQSSATAVQVAFENGVGGFGGVHNVTINPSNGTAGVLTGFTSVSIQPFGPGYVYTLITAPAGGALVANPEWRIINSGNSIWLGRPQFEAGAFATSYIPTAASQVTRAGDVASMLGANFASWFNAANGSFLFEGNSAYGAGGMIGSTPTTGAIMYGNGNSIRTFNGTNFVGTANTFANNAVFKATVAYSASGRSVVLNSGTVATDANLIQIPTAVNLGSAFGGGFINGHVRSITYYPTRLTNAQLQAITA